MVTLLLFSVLVVGNFLRDGESNYLEGALLVVSAVDRQRHDVTDKSDYIPYRCDCGLVLSQSGCGDIQWDHGEGGVTFAREQNWME
jgi:hypothetical protein